MKDDLVWRFRRSVRVSERSVDELIGVCRGVLADGSIVQAEAEFLLGWMKANRAECMEWPVNMLYGRVSEMLQDSVLDSDERKELFDLLSKITGGVLPKAISETGLVVSGSIALPLDDPAPSVKFENHSFCFTGEMCCGTRRDCEAQVIELGGMVKSSVSKKLDYLVVGTIGSLSWIHSTHGRKIEEAVSLRDSGLPISIIGEQHWLSKVETRKSGIC